MHEPSKCTRYVLLCPKAAVAGSANTMASKDALNVMARPPEFDFFLLAAAFSGLLRRSTSDYSLTGT
jgi:hypothetical protein